MSSSVATTNLDDLADLVETYSGLRFTGGRRSELLHKAKRVFASSGCRTWEEYLTRLQSSAGEDLRRRLLEALTVGETYFFRHQPSFKALEREALPEMIARKQGTRRLRAWCAGCATGEEAYSIAILLHRALADRPDWRISVLATDLNRTFLSRAEDGLYGSWSFRETDATFKETYFTREGSRYRIRPNIRGLVNFAYLNLADNVYPSPATHTEQIDLIFCRNVLIYIAPEVAVQVVTRLGASLAPGGWLMLGPSDPFPGLLPEAVIARTPDATLYRRVDGASGHGSTATRNTTGTHGPPARSPLLDASVPSTMRRTSVSIPEVGHSPTVEEPSSRALLDRERQRFPTHGDVSTPPARSDTSEDWRTIWRMARSCADRGDFEAAEQHCQHGIAAAGDQPELYYLLGSLREGRHDSEGALNAFRQALYLDRAFLPAHLALAAWYRRDGNQRLADQAIRRARNLLVGRDPVELVLAEEGLTVGRLRDALAQIAGVKSPPEGC